MLWPIRPINIYLKHCSCSTHAYAPEQANHRKFVVRPVDVVQPADADTAGGLLASHKPLFSGTEEASYMVRPKKYYLLFDVYP